MEPEEETGIFLFKNSKTKISTETIFVEEPKKEAEESLTSKNSFSYGKWMKKFLRRLLRPSMLHTPIPAITGEEIVAESKNLPIFKDEQGELVELKQKIIRKVTRGNRRHKIKTRRQRNLKKLKQ